MLVIIPNIPVAGIWNPQHSVINVRPGRDISNVVLVIGLRVNRLGTEVIITVDKPPVCVQMTDGISGLNPRGVPLGHVSLSG